MPALVQDNANILVEPRRIFGKIGHDRAVAKRKRLQTAVRGAIRLNRLFELVELNQAGDLRRRIRRKRVVNHVCAHLARTNLMPVYIEDKPVFFHAHMLRRERKLRTPPSALRTTIRAELTVVHVFVFERCSALLTKAAVAYAIAVKLHIASNAERH